VARLDGLARARFAALLHFLRLLPAHGVQVGLLLPAAGDFALPQPVVEGGVAAGVA
jgi:hypothetical protein